MVIGLNPIPEFESLLCCFFLVIVYSWPWLVFLPTTHFAFTFVALSLNVWASNFSGSETGLANVFGSFLQKLYHSNV